MTAWVPLFTRVSRFNMLRHALQTAGELLQLPPRQLRFEFLAGTTALLLQLGIQHAKRGSRMTPIAGKLAHEMRQHVEIADHAKLSRDSPQAPPQLAGRVGIVMQDRQQLAEPAGRDTRTVERIDVPLKHAFRFAREDVDASAQRFV
jgi:hypothetical protein